MTAFNQLLEVILDYIELAKFWVVLDSYEEGVVLRLGKYHRTLGPGLHWVFPFTESVLSDNIVPTTCHVGPISMTTKDSKAVVLGGVLTWSIFDIKKFLLEVESAEDVIEDASYGILGDMIREKDWRQLVDPRSRFRFFVEKRLIRVMAKYGVLVEHFQFSDLTRSRTVRIMGWNGDE